MIELLSTVMEHCKSYALFLVMEPEAIFAVVPYGRYHLQSDSIFAPYGSRALYIMWVASSNEVSYKKS
jgi:hypothetical protein